MNEQALKARIKFIGKEQGKSFNEVWKLLALERFLARLSRSEYSEKFIFKGGLLLSYYLVIGRETSDIDLLARQLNAEKLHIEQIMRETCALKLSDGFQTELKRLDDLDHQHMNYPGFQAIIGIQFGVMTDTFYVDIGVGDVVEPVWLDWPSFKYKDKPLFDDLISLKVYPVETIFAEKLETIISRGAANSRMKDYHDLLLLSRENHLIDKVLLKNNIEMTFQNRGIIFSGSIQFEADELERMQVLWAGHLRTLGGARVQTLGLPEKINAVIDELNKWMSAISLSLDTMETYQNKSGVSGVIAYEVGSEFIKVKFNNSDFVYLYNYEIPGALHVEEMKKKAIDGIGLATYINIDIKNKYYKKIRNRDIR